MTPNDPPKWLNALLIWFCDNDREEEIDGDLLEAYRDQRNERGKTVADVYYFISVIKFFKPRFMQKLRSTQEYAPRFGNYLKVAIRNLIRYRYMSAVNLLGFALGLSVVVLAGEYLNDQLTAESHVPDAERVYRITRGYRSQIYSCLGFPQWYESTASQQLASATVFRELPEVEALAQFTTASSAIMGREFFAEANGRRLAESDILFTNTPEAFQEIFDWKVLAGSTEGSLTSQVLITQSSAEKYFGADWASQAIGSPILVGDANFLIKAVIEDVPDNAHFHFGIAALVDSIPYTWGAYTYARLGQVPGDLRQMEEKLTEAYFQANPAAIDDENEKGLSLQPISDIHLGSDHLYELERNVNPFYIYLFAVIGGVMLLIVVANYINLTIAIYANRYKEIGVRKTLGARKGDIRFQFLFESAFLTLLALPVSIVLTSLALPYFNQLLDVQLSVAQLLSPAHLAVLIAFSLVLGLACGLYPAMLLSRRSLLSLFRKNKSAKMGAVGLRKVLIGVQFALLLTLSGYAFFVNRQLDYVHNRELGFDKEDIMYFRVLGAEKYELMRTELLKNPNVLAVGNGGLPGDDSFNTVNYRFEESEEVFDDANQIYMDLASAEMLGLWSPAFEQLTNGKERVLVLNEAAALKYEQITGNEQQQLIGKQIIESPQFRNEDGTLGFPEEVDGFIKNFNYFSLRQDYNPMVIQVFKNLPWAYAMHVKINPEVRFETMKFIESTYDQFEKERPFNANFLENRLDALYGNENRIASLVVYLSYLSVILALAGLVGLTYYMTKVREKELAIRKVLGAGIGSLLGLMSREYALVALVSLVVALPVTLLAANQWLNNFAFHIEPDIFSLIILAGLGMLIMLAGVISQSYRTAGSNPTEALKQE